MQRHEEEDSSDNSSQHSFSSLDSDECLIASGIEPYQFEPRRAVDMSSNDEESEENEEMNEERVSRIGNTEWCTCGNCVPMPREEENVCCQEINAIDDKKMELVAEGFCQDSPACITDHPGFEGVCLNRWVLETVWYQYKQHYCEPYEGPIHKRNRHIAYRQLVRWCWRVLGKEIRVVLPSCAVASIRRQFPPPGGVDQFEGFHYWDE